MMVVLLWGHGTQKLRHSVEEHIKGRLQPVISLQSQEDLRAADLEKPSEAKTMHQIWIFGFKATSVKLVRLFTRLHQNPPP